MTVDLSTSLGGARLPAAVLAASGCGGTGRELARFVEPASLGALVTPSLTSRPQPALPGPRLAETPGGVVVAPGAPNTGADRFAADELPWLHERRCRVVVSATGSTQGEFADVAARVRASTGFPAVVGVELDLVASAPEAAGRPFGSDPVLAGKVVALVRERLPRDVPVVPKLAGSPPGLVDVARACLKGGAEALTVTPAIVADVPGPGPAGPVGDVAGTLCGPAVLPATAHGVRRLHRAMADGRLRTVPVLASGGVSTGADAFRLVLAGASGVQVGTALLADPRAVQTVQAGLADLLQRHGFTRLRDAVGAAHHQDRSR
ncbi:MAG TPA: dihydroorotate dehydrogenase [Segeticoccus sp.]|nr:dihydroorotate dehydrogenase [Segeticoccus sp.]